MSKFEGSERLTNRELRKLPYDAFSDDVETLNGDGWCEGNMVNDGIYDVRVPIIKFMICARKVEDGDCLLYTSPSPRDRG